MLSPIRADAVNIASSIHDSINLTTGRFRLAQIVGGALCGVDSFDCQIPLHVIAAILQWFYGTFPGVSDLFFVGFELFESDPVDFGHKTHR